MNLNGGGRGPQRRILILSCGLASAFHCLRIWKKNFKHQFYLVGTDIYPDYLIPSAQFLNQFYQVPPHSNQDYYSVILNIIKQEKIDIILPIFDADQMLFYPENKDLKNLKIFSLGTPLQTLKIYHNKNKMFSFLKKHGFNVPNLYKKENINSNINYFVKPIHGFGSKNSEILNGESILQNSQEWNHFLIQECVFPPEITLECFYFEKVIKTIARERIETKSGVCTKAKVFYDFDLEKIALNFAQKIKTPLYFNLQFMKNKNNEWVIIDVNLRFAAGMSLSYQTKWDAITAIGQILNHSTKNIFNNFPTKIMPTFVVRFYEDLITKVEKECVAFDLDGTLLNTNLRHRLVLDDILKKYRLNINTEKLIFHKRKGINNIHFLLKKGIHLDEAKKIQKEWLRNIEKDIYLKHDILYPNTIHILTRYFKNYKLILITARQRKKSLMKQIQHLKLQAYFDKIYVVHPHNATEEKAKILKHENAILMVGDSEVDFYAAKMNCIAFKWMKYGLRNKRFMENQK